MPGRSDAWPRAAREPRVEGTTPASRIRGMVDAHFDALWRFLRRLGVASMDLDDALQEVIVIAAARLDAIPVEKEKSFLFSTAFRVASEWRRFRGGRREVDLGHLAERADPVPDAGVLVDQARARTMLDRLLDEMPLELRAVFTLYEIEELTMAEVAELLELPPGTVASRLRRARAHFEARVEQLQARMQRMRGPR